MAERAMIDAKALAKRYGPTRAVDGVSFQVRKGEILGFLGPNGAGKTTTMRMLTGNLAPTAGSVLVGGMSVEDDPLSVRRLIGYLPENAPLYDEMMVIDFLRFAARIRELPSEGLDKRLRGICERCGLMDVLGRDIGQLSKGYRQRVGLAQAMMHDPDLLILDEPTSGLDPNQIVEIRKLIKDLGRDKTVILSTHILPEVQATCNRILIMNEGKLVADDTPEGLTERQSGSLLHLELKGELDRKAVEEALGAVEGLRGVKAEKSAAGGSLKLRLSVAPEADPREAVFAKVVEKGWVLLRMEAEQASLEDIFRSLTLGENKGGDHA